MNGSGRAGNGRGNNRKRPFRHWNKENNAWQEKELSLQGSGTSQKNDVSKGSDNSQRNRTFHRGTGRMHEKRTNNRGPDSENQSHLNRGGLSKRNGQGLWGEKVTFVERPKWVPPVMNTEPLPVPVCPWCGKPIRDISSAIADKDTDAPVHFDCVTARVALGENLEQGETIVYIGGGRFGIVSFGNQNLQGKMPDRPQTAGSDPADEVRMGPDRRSAGSPPAGLDWNHDFKIKKVIEWESKDKRAAWRATICDHYSVT